MTDPPTQISQTSYGDYTAMSVGGAANINIYQAQPSSRLPPMQRPPRVPHFTGRESELAQLLADLQPGRVVTLCGPGGIGKSSLAAEAIWTLAPGDDPPDAFPDGVIFHNFYNQPQVALALENIALTFGQEPRPTPRDAAQRVLAGRRVLVVLDGTEEADNLSEISAVLGDCGVLVTSRRRSDALATRQDIQPLPVDESVKLLQAWAGGRAADEAIVCEICEMLGNLPLAVRLVGRYLNQAAEEAADYLDWLKESPLQALDHGRRQQESVPLLLERSLTKVSTEAQHVLIVVGLLAIAPFSQEVVIAALDTSAGDVRQRLGELVNYGFLVRNDERYLVTHALIHTYAREKLTSEPEMVANLANFYGGFVQEQQKAGAEGYIRLDVERAHIQSVLGQCVQRQEWVMALNLVWDVDDYLFNQSYLTNWTAVINSGLQAAQELGDRKEEAAFLGKMGLVSYLQGGIQESIGYYEQALDIAVQINNRLYEAIVLDNLGSAYSSLGRLKKAKEHYLRAIDFSREIGYIQGAASSLGNLGGIHRKLGNMEQAISFYEQAILTARSVNYQQGEASHLSSLGSIYHDLGQIRQAIDSYEQALSIYQQLGYRIGEAGCLGDLGNAYRDLGLAEKARGLFEQALAIAQETGHRQGEASNLNDLGNVYRDTGDVKKALEYFEEALSILHEIGNRQDEAMGLNNIGVIYHDLGQINLAIDFYHRALDIFQEIGYRHGEELTLGNYGFAYHAMGDLRRAEKNLQQALIIARELGDRHGEENHIGRLGNVYHTSGDLRKAVECYNKAYDISHEIGHRQDQGKHLGNLGLAYVDLGQTEKATKYYRQALSIARETRDRVNEGKNLQNLGRLYTQQDNVVLALQYLQQALTIFEIVGSRYHAEVSRRLLAELEEVNHD